MKHLNYITLDIDHTIFLNPSNTWIWFVVWSPPNNFCLWHIWQGTQFTADNTMRVLWLREKRWTCSRHFSTPFLKAPLARGFHTQIKMCLRHGLAVQSYDNQYGAVGGRAWGTSCLRNHRSDFTLTLWRLKPPTTWLFVQQPLGYQQKTSKLRDTHKGIVMRRAFPCHDVIMINLNIMTSWNGNIFRVTVLCAGNPRVTGGFPLTKGQ